MKRLISIVLIALASSAPLALAQGKDPATLARELENSRAQLYELESHTNHLDPRLAEPLFHVAARLTDLGEFVEAHQTLDRAMQIVRINNGLYTRSQVPYLKAKIDNYARGQNWEGAREQMEHLLWLYRTKSPVIDDTLVRDLTDLSDVHLEGVARDNMEFQSYHLRRAVAISWLALAAGESLWGQTDERLTPLLYGLVKQFHIHSAAIDRGGRVAYELRQIVPGSDWVRERVDAKRYYYYSGLRLLNRVKTIYERSEPSNREGLAMAHLYLADWQVLFERDAEALNNYQLAYEGLVDAGSDPGKLAQFFGHPTLVPETDFFPTLDEAMNARASSSTPMPVLANSLDGDNTLYFSEWSPAFPFVRPPSQQSVLQEPESNFALFSFSLTGVPDVTHWLDSRREKGFSTVQEPRIVETRFNTEDEQKSLLRRLRYLRFRPQLQDGLPQESDATLMYQLAGDLRD